MFRGYIFRKNNKFNFIKQSVNKPKMSHRGREKFPGGQTLQDNKGKPVLNGTVFAKELKEMPDHSNKFTRQTE